MSGEPGEALFQMHIRFGHSGLFDGETHEASGVAVTFCFERSIVAALPGADEGGHAPSTIGLLVSREAFDDGAWLLGFEQIGNFRGSPQEKSLIVQRAPFVAAEKKFAKIAEQRLEFCFLRVLAGSEADGNGGERGAEIWGVVGFPRLSVKIQPNPRAFGRA